MRKKRWRRMKRSEFLKGLSKLYAELAEITGEREYLEKAIEYFKLADEDCECVKNKAKVLKHLIKERRRLK